MRALLIALIVASGTAHAAPNTMTPGIANVGQSATPSPYVPMIMTFQAWKNLRLEEGRLILERLTLENQMNAQPQADRAPGERQAVVRQPVPEPNRVVGRSLRSTGAPGTRLDTRVEQARLNLEIAQDLTINDYIHIYLAQFKTREALQDVARRMSPEEVAELLIAYQKLSLGGSIADNGLPPSPRLTPPRAL